MLQLDLLTTLAVAAGALAIGQAQRRAVPLLARYNLPGPVLGGLTVAAAAYGWRWLTGSELAFDATLREPLMIAFFTSIGFSASWRLLRQGGPLVVALLALAAGVAAVQAAVGAGVAAAMGQPPLLGVLCGTVTMAGGPSTGLAFADAFEAAGVQGAAAVAVSAAMLGILAAGVLGPPLGTWLVERGRRRGRAPTAAAEIVRPSTPGDLPWGAAALLQAACVLALAMGAGAWVSRALVELGVTLPAYIGAMLVAAALRNLDDGVGASRLPHPAIAAVGEVALSFFLALALVTLDLGQIREVAGPLVALVAVQIVLTGALCLWPVYAAMGRDYDAAVITGGFFGFMIGTTPVAVANMDALASRYGPSPRAFLTAPLVGAFFIDFSNALITQICLNVFS